MPRISLVPQNREFFHLLSNASANAVGISRQLVGLLERFPANGDRLSEIKALEHEGDRLTREVVDLLNRTFVTPFDRDDIYNLATAIDDVCDHVDEAAGDIVGFGVVQVRPKATEQAQVISAQRRAARRGREAASTGSRIRATSCAHCAISRTRATGSTARRLRPLRVRDGPDRGDPVEGHPRAARGGRGRVRERGRRARGDSRQEPIAPGSAVDDVLLVTVIVVALAFDFTNGFHDTANAVATSVSTRALPPRIAVLIASVANLAGAFVTTAVAKTIGQDIVSTELDRPTKTILAAPVGGDRLEPAHVVARTAVELVARADRRSGRRGARPGRLGRRALARARARRRRSPRSSRPSSRSRPRSLLLVAIY